MSDEAYIGVAELSVQLSSMNPLRYINERDAYLQLERSMIQACLKFYSDERHSDLLEGPIAPDGVVQKYFKMKTLNGAMKFGSIVRDALLASGLPFKICIGKGKINGGGLYEQWKEILDTEQSKLGAEEIGKLLEHFSTDDLKKVEWICEVYKSPSFSDDIVDLGLDAQNFKGLGMHFTESLGPELIESEPDAFYNAFPVFGKGILIEASKFIDTRLPFSEADVVYRYREQPGAEVQTSGLGSESQRQIESILNLLNHSYSARRDSTGYYASALINLIRSSHFAELEHVEKREQEDGVIYEPGWQFVPPIMDMLLSASFKAKFKSMPGCGMVLACLFDEVISSKSNEPPSCALDFSSLTQGSSPSDYVDIETLSQLARKAKVHFGERVLQSVFDQPSFLISEPRKKSILKIISN